MTAQERTMTAQEMGEEIAKIYIEGDETRQRAILSCFTDEEKAVFLRGVGVIRMFNDQKYYDAVKSATCKQIMAEIYGA